MIWLRSLTYLIYFYGLTTLSLVVYTLLLPFNRIVTQRAVGIWAHIMTIGLRVICGCEMEVRGRENIPKDEAVIFASKHLSAWETFIFYQFYDDPSYVLKKELMSIPIWGWLAVRAQHVPVDRSAGMSALKGMVRTIKDRLAAHRHVIIFPEGTRIAPGADADFHPGIAALYSQTGAKIIPVAVNSGMFWGKKSFTKYPGKITLEFLPAMEEGLDRKTFMRKLKERINSQSYKLCLEARDEFGLTHIALPALEADKDVPSEDSESTKPA